MQSFTVCLPIACPAWAAAFRGVSFAVLGMLAVGATPVAADDLTAPVTAALVTPLPDLNAAATVPRPLSAPDADRYRQIFRLQDGGNWRAADRLIARLGDTRLLGHILAQRYLHPTQYKSSYAELRDWLARYADHPEAVRINKLALARKPADAAAPQQPEATVDRIGNPDSGREAGGPNWQDGLAAWRLGRMTESARAFERVATAKDASSWAAAAGAFWAARSHLKGHRPEQVSRWLRLAAEHPRTFYGQLARRALGMTPGLEWAMEPLSRGDARAVLRTRGGLRALALVQIGETALAEEEMHLLLEDSAGVDLAPALLSIGQTAGLPSVSIRLGFAIKQRSGTVLDAALYPVPAWEPTDGFSIDPALLFALMRQESAFDPDAQSPAGASGLMQLMPRTAASVTEAGDLAGEQKRALFDPEFNLTLAQRYVRTLLTDPNVMGDLLLLAVAYNAGPGNLAKWRAERAYDQDPLLFIESIPLRETRQYIERVLTNYWIYQQRLQQASPSLDALASGAWPIYEAPAFERRTTLNGSY